MGLKGVTVAGMVGTLLEPPPRLFVRRGSHFTRQTTWKFTRQGEYMVPFLHDYNTLPFQIAMKGEWVTSVAVQPMEHWHSAREHREISGGVGG